MSSLRFAQALALVLIAVPGLLAHDLFFRASAYRVKPGADHTVDVFSGTFSNTENGITRDRLSDLSLTGPAGRQPIAPDRWTGKDPKSTVRFTAGAAGTYVLGASLKPRMLALPGDEFNAYLKDEGIDDVLARRKSQGRLAEGSRERYSKYVKALFQVGDATTASFGAVLGYAAEIIPEQNPYTLKPGATMAVRCIVAGQPWAGKVIFAGGRLGDTDKRIREQRLTTDRDGRATVRLTDAGIWYVKFVAMTEAVGDREANYESRWSTISFAVP